MRFFTYRYVGVLRNGRKVKGYVVAESPDEAVVLLERRGIFVTSIRKRPAFLDVFTPITAGQHVLFLESLAKLLRAGVSITRALEELATEQVNPRYAAFLKTVLVHMEEGMRFYDALERTGILPRDAVEVIKVGEESGKLVEVLMAIAQVFRERERMKKAYMSAAVYPSIVLLMALGVLLYSPKVFAKMQSLYSRIPNARMPKFSLIVAGFAQSFVQYLPAIVMVVVAMIGVIVWYRRRNATFRLRLDSFILKLPLVGRLIITGSNYRAFLSLYCAVQSGTPMDTAVALVVDTQWNEALKQGWVQVAREVKRGLPLSKALIYHPYVSGTTKLLVTVGEESGKLDEELEHVTSGLKENFSQIVSFVSNSATPVLLAVTGLIVGIVVAAMYMPILQIPKIMRSIFAH